VSTSLLRYRAMWLVHVSVFELIASIADCVIIALYCLKEANVALVRSRPVDAEFSSLWGQIVA
jgi:hypothetical protein